MIKRFRIWLVRRWLDCLEPEELVQHGRDRQARRAFSNAYETLGTSMLKIYNNMEAENEKNPNTI